MPYPTLSYLYVGTANFDADVKFYTTVLGARLEWAFDRFEAKVAGLRLGEGPLVVLADHRPAGECRLLYEIESLEQFEAHLRAQGVEEIGRVDIPPGRCLLITDKSGNKLGFFEATWPNDLKKSYENSANKYAIREDEEPEKE
jgi:catechol 2,3-dioxygenase-like lactoylglutathione lyase family enzyme